VAAVGSAQPHYVAIGALAAPTSAERGEAFDAASGTLFSIIYWTQAGAGGNTHDNYSTKVAGDVFSWTKTTSTPGENYWGRACTGGGRLYFNGTIHGAANSWFAPFGANGLLGAWQSTTALPSVNGSRSLHQTFIYGNRLYVIGGWHGDGQPAYADAWYAPIQGNGALGIFVQTTSLPTGVVGHSATVSPHGMIYVANDTNLFTGQIAGDGTVGSWSTEPAIPGLQHNNIGNTAVALVSNLLVIVGSTTTHVCRLDNSGHLAYVATTISNPASFGERSAYANNGTVYVTATTGNIYRIDHLPFEPPCSPHKATATATLFNGFVVGVTITDSGCGYTNAPAVLIQGGGGTGATATAVVSNGVVVSLSITDAGSGYTSVPRIVIGSPPFVPALSIAVSKVKVTQNVVLGRNYLLESSNDLATWTATGPQFTADSETIVNEFDVDVTGRFFRIRQVP